MGQILFGLSALHARNICHRGLTVECISLVPLFQAPNKSQLKIGRASYHSRILELHRSNHIVDEVGEAWAPPEAWAAPEALGKPLEYPPSRDIWATGVILLQMLRGFSITEECEDPYSALEYGEPITQGLMDLLTSIFVSNRKKSPSCTELTRRLSQISGPIIASGTIPILGMPQGQVDSWPLIVSL